MNAFLTTAHAVAPIALTAAAICAGAYLGIKAADKWAGRNVDRMVDEGLAAIRDTDVDRVVFDTVEMWRRDQDANRIARDVRAAFEAQLKDRPHLAAIRARQEAAVLDDDQALADWIARGWGL